MYPGIRKGLITTTFIQYMPSGPDRVVHFAWIGRILRRETGLSFGFHRATEYNKQGRERVFPAESGLRHPCRVYDSTD
jgi:hypothetical protein